MSLIRRWLVLALIVLSANAANAASTSNLEREKSWADQITDTLIAGEAISLTADGTAFLALYTAPPQPATKGLLLLHGRGVHPAWGFIDTLRVDFADAGWHTLSIQLPILENDAKFSEYGKTMPEALNRVDAALRYLRDKGVQQIFLVGHSTGATTAVAHAAQRPASPVAGIVAIGLTSEPAAGPLMQAAPLLERTKKPTLDIFGADDLPVVLQTANARRTSARRGGNPRYTQERVPGANHFFTDRYDPLRARMTAWLGRAVK